MKKRMIAILLTFALTISGSAMAWAAPEDGTQGSAVSEEGAQDNIVPEEVENSEGMEEKESGTEENEANEQGLYEEEIDNSQETDSFTLNNDSDPNGELSIEKQDIILNQSNTIWDGTIANSFCGGSGTASDPYLIGNGSELAYFQQMVNSGNSYEGQYIALSSDIYLNEISDYDSWSDSNSPSNCWTGISDFAGNFNGCSHTIYGLYMYGADNTGFFNEINNDTETVIKNLDFKNAYVHGQSYVGIIVGNGSHIQMDKCSVSGKVMGNDIVGGLMGTSDGGSIINNTNYASVTGANYVGGIFGSYENFYSLDNGTYFGTHSVLTDCINKGEIYGNGDYVGGIAGYLGYNTNALDCIRLGNENMITGTGFYVGGIFGQYDVNDFGVETSKKFEQCYNLADISGGDDVGGIVGHMDINENRVTLQDSYNSGTCTKTLSEYDSVAGIVGAIRRSGNCRITIQRCHNTGKISDSSNNAERAIIGGDQVVVTGGRLQIFCCYYLSNSAPNSTNGISLTPEEMVDSEKFSQFDFNGVWKMGIKYPVLLWQETNSVIENPDTNVTTETIQGVIEHSYCSMTDDTKVEELLSEYVDDWYHAYSVYISTVEKTLMDSIETSAPTKKEAIKRRKEEMMKADDNSNNKEKYITMGGKFPDEKTKEAVYEALSTFLYEAICSCSEIDLSDISAEEINQVKLANTVLKSVKKASISKTYKINGIKISIKTSGISDLSFGEITYNSKILDTCVFCPTISQCQKSITNYMKELMGLADSAIYQVYSSICKDVFDVSLDKLTQNYLKQNLTKRVSKYASKFNASGVGKLATNLNKCYNYYKYIEKMLGIKDSKESPEKILEAMKTYEKEFEDSSISDKVVEKTWEKLKKAAINLNEAYLSYLSGTDSKLGIWWDRIKPKWGEKYTKNKVTFSCPVDVSVLDSLGEQIGYAGEDDVWFDNNIIYIEEKGDAKIIYSSSEEPISFNVSATAYGVLGCSIEDYDEIGLATGRTNYYDIELYPGKNITVSGIKNTTDGKIAYTVTSDGQTINANEYIPSTQNGVISIGCNVINNGTVNGTGSYVRGDAIVLTATPSDNSHFIGWMQGEHLLDTTRFYEFTAKENTEITALFADIPDTNEEEAENPNEPGNIEKPNDSTDTNKPEGSENTDNTNKPSKPNSDPENTDKKKPQSVNTIKNPTHTQTPTEITPTVTPGNQATAPNSNSGSQTTTSGTSQATDNINQSQTKSVNTGDNTQILLMIICSISALGIMIGVMKKRKVK